VWSLEARCVNSTEDGFDCGSHILPYEWFPRDDEES
jgi:hypothetical protein